jgi:hypothetical protein
MTADTGQEVSMAKTNFEKLQVYQLAEKLADDVWNIVIRWDSFGNVPKRATDN